MFRQKIERLLSLVHLLVFFANQLLSELLFEIRETYAILLSWSMIVEWTLGWRVNLCQPVFVRVEIWRQRWRISQPKKQDRCSWCFGVVFFSRRRPECKFQSFQTTARQNETDHFIVDGLCSHCNAVLKSTGSLYHFCPSQEVRGSLTEEDNNSGCKKRELDELMRPYIQLKASP